MEEHTFKGKRKLCYTDICDFTDFQGVGRDPLYKRFDSVFSVVEKVVAPEYQHFLAAPEYVDTDDQIRWHINAWNEFPQRYVELSGTELTKYRTIKEKTIQVYRDATQNCSGEDLQILLGAIRYIDDDRIFCCDDKVFVVAWGMTLDEHQHKVIGSVIHGFDYINKYKITFNAGEHGKLVSKIDATMARAEGHVLSDRDLPQVSAEEGWTFDGWSPTPNGLTVNSDLNFVATYKQVNLQPEPAPVVIPEPAIEEPISYTCTFEAGKCGKVNGTQVVQKEAGSTLTSGEIPQVSSNRAYKFSRWSPSPENTIIDGDKTFVAQYTHLSWWRRFWKWLLLALLILLSLLVLSLFLFNCHGCRHRAIPINEVLEADEITTPDGIVVEDNGIIEPIHIENDGRLPDVNDVVAPVVDDDREFVPIVSRPNAPNIIANRLFLFLEEENDNIESLARDFKKEYPDDRYSIIGFDRDVKLLVIQIPETERDHIRQTINARIPNHKFIVFDEEIYELEGEEETSIKNKGWHLDAIHLKQGWRITKGSSNVKIAIVDDGIDASHPMFKDRIVEPYNVFRQDNRLSLGEGHGTHTAGLAAGCADFYNLGAAGVAPDCKIMPIQVFDNKQCPLSALIAGVMYAIHHDADVVNISIAPSFEGLNRLPVAQQDAISKRRFKNVERLWARVCSLAAKKNCILVFAAGNDDILSSIPPENRNTSSIVVAAVDRNLYPTDFTNYGPRDICAPGKGIYSAYPRGSFASCDGTSMAAPIVAGTIGLMKSLKKDLTVVQARNVLYKTGADVYGYMPPMVLVDKALVGVQKRDFSTPVVRPMPSVPNGGGDNFAENGSTYPVVTPTPIVGTTPIRQIDAALYYNAIRRQITEYQKRIAELEKLLP